MIDITGKAATQRSATARGRVLLNEAAREALREGRLPKGDAVEVARIAGIMAAKKCAELVPYCHQIPLQHVTVAVSPTDAGVEITATARAEASTGVEMEALTAVTVAALTIFDMCKALDKGIEIREVMLQRKTGGKSGDYNRQAQGATRKAKG